MTPTKYNSYTQNMTDEFVWPSNNVPVPPILELVNDPTSHDMYVEQHPFALESNKLKD